MIESISVAGCDPLVVYEDPRPASDGPGADGHAGIAGLVPDHRHPKGREKEQYRAFQVRLSDTCEPVVEEADTISIHARVKDFMASAAERIRASLRRLLP